MRLTSCKYDLNLEDWLSGLVTVDNRFVISYVVRKEAWNRREMVWKFTAISNLLKINKFDRGA